MYSIPSRVLPWMLAIGLIVSGSRLWMERPLHWGPGVLAAAEPLQTPIEGAAAVPAWIDEAVKLTPRAAFAAKVRVLSRERYRLDRLADAVPEDLAVGWGPMSDSAVINHLEISQSARFYSWRTDDPPIALEEISRHSANWHIVPGNSAVARTLKRIRPGDIITVDGELVDMDKPGRWFARTSLTREDTGAGACEIILVNRLAILWRH